VVLEALGAEDTAKTGLTVPESLLSNINEVAQAATGIAMLASGPTLTGIVTVMKQIPATGANLAAGQFAVIGIVELPPDPERVVVGAYRESGAFAKLVDTGGVDS